MKPDAAICPAHADPCADPYACATLCRRLLLPPIGALHFVGFKDERYRAAVRAFGPPDFIHRTWDARAKDEIGPHDAVVFADGDEHQPACMHGFDDSHEDIVVREGGPWFYIESEDGSEAIHYAKRERFATRRAALDYIARARREAIPPSQSVWPANPRPVYIRKAPPGDR